VPLKLLFCGGFILKAISPCSRRSEAGIVFLYKCPERGSISYDLDLGITATYGRIANIRDVRCNSSESSKLATYFFDQAGGA
jgi:hypothetical protein